MADGRRLELPAGFLWGASTAAHQVEGGNVGNDWWELENADPPRVPERSGDACDSYHRYAEDIGIVADLGLGAYRFSLEWSRIEPERGAFSRAAIDHYRRMVAACHAHGVTPVVTLHHFTHPRWFWHAGHWTAPDAAELFARYCERVRPVLDEGVEWVFTINEPNVLASIVAMRGGARAEHFLPEPDDAAATGLAAAHRAARAVLADRPGSLGWTVATFGLAADDPADAPTATRLGQVYEDRFLAESAADTVIGVQAYTRVHVGPSGIVPPPDGVETTQMGWEYLPGALGSAVRHAAAVTGGTPCLVTENGVATEDDDRRIDYLHGALGALADAAREGVDVRGYLHWSLLDNFEWAEGFRPRFGLVAVDRTTFARTPKPSAHWYGTVARTGVLPAPTSRTGVST